MWFGALAAGGEPGQTQQRGPGICPAVLGGRRGRGLACCTCHVHPLLVVLQGLVAHGFGLQGRGQRTQQGGGPTVAAAAATMGSWPPTTGWLGLLPIAARSLHALPLPTLVGGSRASSPAWKMSAASCKQMEARARQSWLAGQRGFGRHGQALQTAAMIKAPSWACEHVPRLEHPSEANWQHSRLPKCCSCRLQWRASRITSVGFRRHVSRPHGH